MAQEAAAPLDQVRSPGFDLCGERFQPRPWGDPCSGAASRRCWWAFSTLGRGSCDRIWPDSSCEFRAMGPVLPWRSLAFLGWATAHARADSEVVRCQYVVHSCRSWVCDFRGSSGSWIGRRGRHPWAGRWMSLGPEGSHQGPCGGIGSGPRLPRWHQASRSKTLSSTAYVARQTAVQGRQRETGTAIMSATQVGVGEPVGMTGNALPDYVAGTTLYTSPSA
jgi:hypothetical protein